MSPDRSENCVVLQRELRTYSTLTARTLNSHCDPGSTLCLPTYGCALPAHVSSLQTKASPHR